MKLRKKFNLFDFKIFVENLFSNINLFSSYYCGSSSCSAKIKRIIKMLSEGRIIKLISKGRINKLFSEGKIIKLLSEKRIIKLLRVLSLL